MKKFMQKAALLSLLGVSMFSFAQVGVQSNTPTETLDVKGTARIQTLPEQGDPITTRDNGEEGTNTFKPTYYVFADENGVLGKVPKTDSSVLNPDGYNDSNAIFVIKNYLLPNDPSNVDNGNGVNTLMDVDKWEPFYTFKGMDYRTSSVHPFTHESNEPIDWGVELVEIGGTWRIKGGIKNLNENMKVSILFIKKGFVINSDEVVVPGTF